MLLPCDAIIRSLSMFYACRTSGTMMGTSALYESLLRVGKAKKVCTACNRHLDDKELVIFEKYACSSCLAFGTRVTEAT